MLTMFVNTNQSFLTLSWIQEVFMNCSSTIDVHELFFNYRCSWIVCEQQMETQELKSLNISRMFLDKKSRIPKVNCSW